MGNLCSNEIRTEEDDMASRDIERQLKEDEEKFKKISRLLLLGKKESSSFFFFHHESINAFESHFIYEQIRSFFLYISLTYVLFSYIRTCRHVKKASSGIFFSKEK